LFLALLPLASSISFSDGSAPEYIFKQGTQPQLLFTCEDVDDAPCPSNFACNITVAYPNNSLLIDNQLATHNSDHYNITLPNTDTLGLHAYGVYCSNNTNFGTASELYYLINVTGEELNVSKTILYIFVLVISLVLFLLCLYGSIKIPWNNKTDDQGYIVEMNDLKYVKLFLWFITYFFLLFISWLTSSVAKFLELGMAAKFFDIFQSFLLILFFPVFLIVFATGLFKAFSERNFNKLIGRNLKIR
jgi:hypothetical protein